MQVFWTPAFAGVTGCFTGLLTGFPAFAGMTEREDGWLEGFAFLLQSAFIGVHRRLNC